jgi:peptide/nickel transport system permease protein
VVRRKIVGLVTTLLAASVITFFFTSLLPGDPAVAILGPEGVTKESLAAVHAELHLNQPWPERYITWLGRVVRGDFGHSFVLNRSVGSEIKAGLPVTAEIIVLAVLIALLVAVPLGVVTAWKAGSVGDKLSSLTTFTLLSIPTFVISVFLILIFAVHLRWLPPSGWVALSANPWQNLRTAILPAVALALPQVAVFSRLLRGDMRTTLEQDFVAFADSKGISTWRILIGHALRPSSFSLVTVAGLQVGFLMGGTVVVETLFNVPGIGSLLVNAIYQRDLLTVQGVTLFIAAVFVVVNFIVDLLYSVLDPRIRRGSVVATA